MSDALRDTLVALRNLRAAHVETMSAFEVLINDADPGFDPDPVADFDERSIVLGYLDDIRRSMDDLLRMLAAAKGKAALAELVTEID